VWYFGTVPTVWYFGTVPTVWYFLFFILLFILKACCISNLQFNLLTLEIEVKVIHLNNYVYIYHCL
jgi:hypothetical protein